MSNKFYYTVPIPIPEKYYESKGSLTDLLCKIDPDTEFYKELLEFIIKYSTGQILLTTPKTRPSYYNNNKSLSLLEKIPPDYLKELEGLLSVSNTVFILNPKERTTKSVCLKPNSPTVQTKLESIIMSFFVQSIQHINRNSRVLYAMADIPAEHGIGTFEGSPLNQCCVRHLVVKCQKKYSDGKQHDLRLFLAEHADHTSLLDMEAVNFWFMTKTALHI